MPPVSPSSLHPTSLLKEWAKATLASCSWKDALISATSVGIFSFIHLPSSDILGLEFVVPRFTVYWAICECLEANNRMTDASECLRQMADEMAEQVNANDEQSAWALGG